MIRRIRKANAGGGCGAYGSCRNRIVPPTAHGHMGFDYMLNDVVRQPDGGEASR